jgi:hypothetical protein
MFAGLFLGLMARGAQAQQLRSDSPLWTYQYERDAGLYPEAFTDKDSFGCSVPLRLGVYRRIPATSTTDDRFDDEVSFVRIENYGVFHCALLYGEADDRADADKAFEDHAWLIVLDKVRRPDGGEDELLALQIGVRNGSRYELFRRRASDLSAPLEELDWRCPATAEHRVAHLDIWVQDSCVVSSKSDLRGVARSAARRPILATLELTPAAADVPSDTVPS